MFILSVFFVFPVIYSMFFNLHDNVWLVLGILYACFTIGYYFIYSLLYTFRDKSGRLVFLTPQGPAEAISPLAPESIDTVMSRGVLEQSGFGFRQDVSMLIWKKALIFATILMLLLAPMILYFFKDIRYTQIVAESQNKDAIASVAQLLRLKMEDDAKEDLAVLNSIKKEDVVVVFGQHDRVEVVLGLANIPYTQIFPKDVKNFDFKPTQIVMVNCPGNFPANDKNAPFEKLKKFVEDGGFLFTTDWALRYTVSGVVPGYIEAVRTETRDEVMPIKVSDLNSEFTKNITPADGTPSWWEYYSYPMKILDKDKVKMLVKSDKMKTKYGHEGVAAYFDYGKGKIIHTTAHFLQQKSVITTARQSKDALTYVRDELKIDQSKLSESFKTTLKGLQAGQIEDVYSIVRFIANVIVAKKKTQK